jgi:hypothetical protein
VLPVCRGAHVLELILLDAGQLGEPPVEYAFVRLRVQEAKVAKSSANVPRFALRYHENTEKGRLKQIELSNRGQLTHLSLIAETYRIHISWV